MKAVVLTPGKVTIKQLEAIYRQELPAVLHVSTKAGIDRAAALVAKTAAGDEAVYGINTGFGKLANIRIAPEDTATLQRNLILSHCSGVGEAIPRGVARLMMVLKIISLGRGASGIRWNLIELMQKMLAKGVIPLIPAQGSVGASGDLAPLAHMTAVMIGEGQAEYQGKTLSGRQALKAAGLMPIALQAKEGLALINGTQFSTAFALVGLFDAWQAAQTALITSCLSTDAIMGSTAPLEPEIHALRGHRGQIESAATMRRILARSVIRESHRENDTRVQDPYCIRCQPQVTGAAIDLLRQSAQTLVIEANAATDNPLVLTKRGMIVSGGNFHAEPVAFAADIIALAMAEIGAIAQRRIALMVDPTLSFDLPPFLAADPGLNSGFMIAEVTSAALMSENKHLAMPCSTDSTPTSANQEDHVSMAAHGARRLMPMAENLSRILGIELLCSAQGVEFRAPLKTSPVLQRVVRELRKHVATLDHDRYLAPDLERAAELVRTGKVTAATGIPLPELHHRAP